MQKNLQKTIVTAASPEAVAAKTNKSRLQTRDLLKFITDGKKFYYPTRTSS